MAIIMGTAFIVGIFYSLDALHGERRDRSILFWKSLPVSDVTTVLAKASIPLVVLPLIAFGIVVATEWLMLLLSSVVVMGSGLSVAVLWKQVALPEEWLLLFYHLVTVHILWYAPIYAWMLLVSGWARRAAFLWAILPPAAIGILERIAFHTTHFLGLLRYRLMGPEESFPSHEIPAAEIMMHISPGRFLSAPGLWLGLGVAAIFLAAAIRLRRYQGPL
jgi:ABC-2 type transport system permease protein